MLVIWSDTGDVCIQMFVDNSKDLSLKTLFPHPSPLIEANSVFLTTVTHRGIVSSLKNFNDEKPNYERSTGFFLCVCEIFINFLYTKLWIEKPISSKLFIRHCYLTWEYIYTKNKIFDNFLANTANYLLWYFKVLFGHNIWTKIEI